MYEFIERRIRYSRVKYAGYKLYLPTITGISSPYSRIKLYGTL